MTQTRKMYLLNLLKRPLGCVGLKFAISEEEPQQLYTCYLCGLHFPELRSLCQSKLINVPNDLNAKFSTASSSSAIELYQRFQQSKFIDQILNNDN